MSTVILDPDPARRRRGRRARVIRARRRSPRVMKGLVTVLDPAPAKKEISCKS